jgi:hypothetical protein
VISQFKEAFKISQSELFLGRYVHIRNCRELVQPSFKINETNENARISSDVLLHFEKARQCFDLTKQNSLQANLASVRNGGSLKRAFIFTNKEVIEHSNRRSDTEVLRNEYQIYIHEV